jgi:WD40 repeat protein
MAALSTAAPPVAVDDGKPRGDTPATRQGPRTDLYGDALPAGALARLGTLRWRQASPVNYVAFTADGKALLTATADGAIRLWDRDTGKVLHKFERPRPDNQLAGRGPGAGMPVRPVPLPPAMMGMAPYGVTALSVALSPGGKTLAAAGPDNTIQLWQVATGRPLRQIQGPPLVVGALVFSPDGRTLVGRAADQTLYFWKTATGKEIRRVGEQRGNPRGAFPVRVGGNPGGLAFAPDGKTLATVETAFENRKVSTAIKLVDVETGAENSRVEMAPPAAVFGLAFSPDGKALAYQTGNAIHLVEADTGKALRQITGQVGGPAALAFSPDGKGLVVRRAGDAPIRLYDVKTGEIRQRFGGAGATPVYGTPFYYGYGVTAVPAPAFSPDGKFLAAGGDTAVRVWEAATGKEVVPHAGHGGAVTALALSPDGKLVASKGEDGTVRLWDAATGKERHEFRVPGIAGVAFAPDGRTVALGLAAGAVRLYEAATGKELHGLAAHPNGIAALAFSADCKTLASRGTSDNTIRLHDVTTGKALRSFAIQAPARAGPGQPVLLPAGGFAVPRVGLAFSPDGRLVASPVFGSTFPAAGFRGGIVSANSLTLWDTATGKEVRRIGLPGQPFVVGFAFAPDGRAVATENSDGTVTLWEVASGKERARLGQAAVVPNPTSRRAMFLRSARLRAYGGYPVAPAQPTIAFAADGRTLSVRGPDQSVRVWDVVAGKEVVRLAGHDGDVTAVALAADGKTLASGGRDTTVLLWDLTRLRPAPKSAPAELRAAEVSALWEVLAGNDAAEAFQAIGRLAADPRQVVPFLRARLRPAEPLDPRKVEGWVADLDSSKFRLRQQAARELEKVGEQAVPALTRALALPQSLETRRRMEQLLEKLTATTLSAEQVRLVRALEVLERAGTAEARQVLAALGRGAPGALPTREAQAALERLARRSASLP